MTPSPQRYDHIDAIRAIAAVLVVWIHASELSVKGATSGQWLFDTARGITVGGIGVTLFFFVSGFVIPASLRAGRPKGEELRAFGIRRFFRLYPVYWVSMLVGLVTCWWIWGKSMDLGTIALNATMVSAPLGHPAIQSVYWTLFIELVFYVACAGLFALGLLHRPIVLALISTAFFAGFLYGYLPGGRAPGQPMSWLFFTEFGLHLSHMFAGALLRQWYDGELKPGLSRALLLVVLCGWLLVPLYAGSFLDAQGGFVFVYPTIEGSSAIGVALFLVLAFRAKPAWRPLAALGRASYSLYVFHVAIAFGLLWVATQVPAFAWLGADVGVNLAVVLLISIGVAALAYRYIELPMIALGRRLSRPAPAVASLRPTQLHA